MPLTGYAISKKMTKKTSHKGPIGLPTRRIHNRLALVMSAIQEERLILANALRAAPVGTTPSSDLDNTSLTTTDSDLTPDQSQPPGHLHEPSSATTTAIKSPSKLTRCVTKFDELEREITHSSHAPRKKDLIVQSARSGFTENGFHVPTTRIHAPKAKASKAMGSCSVRARPTPLFDDSFVATTATTTTKEPLPKKVVKTCTVQSRLVKCLDDSFLNLRAKHKGQKRGKTTMSLRSHCVVDYDDSLASGPTAPGTKEGWKPRVVCTRPASSPSDQIPRSKSSALLDGQSTDDGRSARQQELVSTVTAEKRKISVSKLTSESKLAKQQNGRHRFHSDDKHELVALVDEGHGRRNVTDSSDDRSLRSQSNAANLSKGKNISSSCLRHYEGKFKNRRGQSLLYFSAFPPKRMAMRGIVIHLHGMGDHCRRSSALFERYCKEGFGVITYDLLNHGESDLDKYNIRAHVTDFNGFVDDTNDFITFAKKTIYKTALWHWRKQHHHRRPHGKEKRRETAADLPLIISGASFGALIGLHTVLSGEHKFHAAVWASPTIGVTWVPVLRIQWMLAWPLVAALPTAKVVPAIQHNHRSRDPVFLQRYLDDPLTSSDMITPCSGYQSLNAMIRLQREKRVSDVDSHFCKIPMLFLAGSDDRISDQQAAMKFYSRMESRDKEFKVFDGLYHMVYEEPEKEDVLQYLVNWLHKRFPYEARRSDDPHVNVTKKLEPSAQRYGKIRTERTDL